MKSVEAPFNPEWGVAAPAIVSFQQRNDQQKAKLG